MNLKNRNILKENSLTTKFSKKWHKCSKRSISHFSPFESWLCLCSTNVPILEFGSQPKHLIMVGTNFTFFNWGFFWKIFFYQAAQDSLHVNMPEAKDNFEVVEVLLVGKGYDKVLWPPGWQVKDHKKKICGFCIYLWEEEVKSNPVEFFLSWLPPIHLIFSTRHSMVSSYIGQSLVQNFRL